MITWTDVSVSATAPGMAAAAHVSGRVGAQLPLHAQQVAGARDLLCAAVNVAHGGRLDCWPGLQKLSLPAMARS